jgi:hypothetical protein
MSELRQSVWCGSLFFVPFFFSFPFHPFFFSEERKRKTPALSSES